MISDDLKTLARILADWAAPAPSAIIYLYGSRVRGDHRQDSDVDIWPVWAGTDAEVEWWTANNANVFADIDAKLPGCLHVLPPGDSVKDQVVSANIVYQDRNVRCVLLPPKSNPHTIAIV